MNTEQELNFYFLLLDGKMAFSRNQDESVDVLKEMAVPVRLSITVLRVSEVRDSVSLLASLERILVAQRCQTAIINPKLGIKTNRAVNR